MGTNFYLKGPRCPTCGAEREGSEHIGKSSAGWCFSLHVDEAHPDLDAWRKAWANPEKYIENEYGERLTPQDMERIITDRGVPQREWESSPLGYASWVDFHARNYSEPGPHGLLRYRIGPYCVGHGSGTWDLVPGSFS